MATDLLRLTPILVIETLQEFVLLCFDSMQDDENAFMFMVLIMVTKYEWLGSSSSYSTAPFLVTGDRYL